MGFGGGECAAAHRVEGVEFVEFRHRDGWRTVERSAFVVEIKNGIHAVVYHVVRPATGKSRRQGIAA